MDRHEDTALSVDEAKTRLRALAYQTSPANWVRGHPWDAVAIAFAAGLLAGTEPRARPPLAEALAKILSEGLVDLAMNPTRE